MRLSPVRRFPAIEETLDDGNRNAIAALAVLEEEPIGRDLAIDNANARSVLRVEPHAFVAHLAREVGRVPDERLLVAQVLARQVARPVQNLALLLIWRDAHRSPDFVERDHRPAAEVVLDPVVLAGPRQTAHQHDLAGELLLDGAIGLAADVAEEEEAGVIAGERELTSEAVRRAAHLDEAANVVEQLLRVGADSAAGIGLGEQRQVIGPGRLTDLDGESSRV